LLECTASMPLRLAILVGLASATFAAGSAPAQDLSGNAPRLMDAWLRIAAAGSEIYRTDVRPGGEQSDLPRGRLFFRSQLLGPFTCRPKTYRELSPIERVSMLGDPGFRGFIKSSREAADRVGGGSPAPGKAAARAGSAALVIPPDEMLRPGALWIFLPR